MSRLLDFLASLRLTVALLVASIVLVFLATLEQVAWGVWHVQDAYFESWGVLYPLAESAPAKFPLPGGFLLGALLCANLVVAQLLFLESENPDKDISLYINSPGGSVSAGLSIFDTMQFIKPDVSTLCMGLAASMGAFLLAAGAKGKRFALPNSRIMIHQPSGGAQGQASDIEIQAREILKLREKLNGILAERTGQPLEKIAADSERDYFMSSEEAKTYGLIDQVLSTRKANVGK